MLPSQASPRPEPASTGVVCFAGRGAARERDRGAVIVHVAVAMTGLLAFAALTVDLGTVWVARAQAQNAVDAAAHAGVVSLAFVNPSDADAARAAAQAVIQQHSVWGDPIPPAAVTMAVGTCPAGAPATSGDCVNVSVERPMPVFFSRMFAAGPSTVRASASGKVMNGNATNCLRPWAIPDRWTEVSGPTDHYDAYLPNTSTPLPGPRDSYVPLGFDTNWTGTQLILERGDVDHSEDVGIVGNQFYMLEMPNAQPDREARYQQNIEQCNGTVVTAGDTMSLTHVPLVVTENGVNNLIAQDPGAYWDGTTVRNSAFGTSPRIVAMALYDPDQLAAQPGLAVGSSIVIRNIVGFFVIDYVGDHLRGIVLRTVGSYNPSQPLVPADSGFLSGVALVR